jgi:hypothetical protein
LTPTLGHQFKRAAQKTKGRAVARPSFMARERGSS